MLLLDIHSLNIVGYFWVPLDTFGDFLVILSTFEYFLVHLGTWLSMAKLGIGRESHCLPYAGFF